MKTKVVSYQRVSTLTQVDNGVSLEAQAAKIESFCSTFDLEVVASLRDEGLSGKSLDGRKGLTAALAMLEAGAASGIVIYSLSRLTRSVRDLGLLLDKYFASQYLLFSVTDQINTQSSSGRLMLNLLISICQFERENCAEKTRDALAHLRSKGVKMGAPPFGYSYGEPDGEGHRPLIAKPEELQVLGHIQQLRRNGHTLQAICDRLTADGIPSKRGGKWSPKLIRDLLIRTMGDATRGVQGEATPTSPTDVPSIPRREDLNQ